MTVSHFKKNLTFWFIFIVIMMTMMNNYLDHSSSVGGLELYSSVIGLWIYFVQIVIILILASTESQRIISIFTNPTVLLSTLILIYNFIISPYNPEYSLLLKYFGYIVATAFGASIANSYQLKLPKSLLYGLIFIPLIIVAFFDNSVIKNSFFPNTNNFVFWGAVVSLLYYISSQNKKRFRNAIMILLLYILVGSTIGILVAFFLSIIILNIKSPKLIIFTGISIIALLVCIKYSDISVFARIRGMVGAMSAVTMEDLRNIEDLNIYQFNQYSSYENRDDGGSALWRIKQWTGMLLAFFRNWKSSFILGLGDSFTVSTTGHYPHNDIFKILCEYGLVVFSTFMFHMYKAFKQIKRDPSIYIMLTIFIYHFSENLIHTFPTSFIFYFAIGYAYNRVKNRQTI